MRQSHERMHDHNKKFGEQLTEWLKDTSDSKKQLDREYQRGREDMRREVVEWAKEYRAVNQGMNPFPTEGSGVVDDLLAALSVQEHWNALRDMFIKQ